MRTWLVVGLLSFFGSAHAALVTIDPGNFLPGTDISNATPGVTLSSWNFSPESGDSFDPVFAADCTADCGGWLQGQRIFSGSQGFRFANTSAAAFRLKFPTSPVPERFNVLRADFAEPTNFVQLIGGGYDGGGDALDLIAFDRNGNEIIRCAVLNPSCHPTLLTPPSPG
jgi:hypothetical protein